jgi:hypothetical protein
MTRVWILTAGMWTLAAGSAVAQLSGPMRKPELVRLLADPTWGVAAVAEQLEQRCLAFTPSPRDRADFVALGADTVFLRLLDACARRESGGEAPAANAAPPQGSGGMALRARRVRSTSPALGVRTTLEAALGARGLPCRLWRQQRSTHLLQGRNTAAATSARAGGNSSL